MSRLWIQWLAAGGIVAALFFGCSRQPGERLYHEALVQQQEGNLIRARTLLEKSIRRRAGSLENAAAFNRLGLLLWEIGDPQAAAEAFSESLRIDTGQADVLGNLGVALSATGDFSGAEQTFREAALMTPNDPRPLAYAGITYALAGKWSDAARNLKRALERTPNDPRLQNALALVELHTGNDESALNRLNAAAERTPDYAPLRFNLASLHHHWRGNPAEGHRQLELFLQQVPAGSRRAALARDQLQALKKNEDGIREFKTPEKRDRPAADRAFRNALTAHKAGELTQAEEGYRQTLELDDRHEQTFYNLGLIYYGQNKLTAAQEAFERAAELNPAFTAARYNIALTEHRRGNNAAARKELETLLTQQPRYQPALDLMDRLKN
jgi:Flp pilus assembly protein TadD